LVYTIACAWFGTAQIIDGGMMVGQRNVHDGNGTHSVSLGADGGATLLDVHHRAFFGNVNGIFTSHVQVYDASDYVLESANARLWGAAGNTVTNALKIMNGCNVQYVTLPTATGAVPGNDVVLAAAAAIAWAVIGAAGGAVAVAPNNAAINVRQ
jgi:hypothetical protein